MYFYKKIKDHGCHLRDGEEEEVEHDYANSFKCKFNNPPIKILFYIFIKIPSESKKLATTYQWSCFDDLKTARS